MERRRGIRFITLVDDIEILLLENNYLGKPYNENVREIILHKNASLYYKINMEKDCLEFLLFLKTIAKIPKVI